MRKPIVVVVVLVLSATLLCSALQAGEECSVATLQGEYLFTGSAERAPGSPDTNFPRAFAGVWTFDGAGNLTVFQTRSYGGEIARRETAKATYTLDSDCTGTYTLGEVNWDLFVSRDGSEGSAIRYDEGTIATRSFKKR